MIVKDKSGIKVEIDRESRIAKVIGCSKKVKNTFVPRFIKYDSQEYPIKIISQEAFKSDILESIDFPEDSEVQIIENNALDFENFYKFYIPPSVTELKGRWCYNTNKYLKITVSPKNQRFKHYNEDLIIGKSDLENDKFDTLYFVSRQAEKIEIPSFIKKINPYAISECNSLLFVKFAENSEIEAISDFAFFKSIVREIFIPKHVKTIGTESFAYCTNLAKIEFHQESELQTIGEGAFIKTNIKHLDIPASLTELKDGWCKKFNSLESFTVSPKNKYFSVFEGKMIVGKSNINEDVYDILYYVHRKVENLLLPPFIKKIGDFALEHSNLQTVSFCDDTKLEIIGKRAFAESTIKNITIPKSVTIIDTAAFKKCIELLEITITEDSQLTVIGKSAFFDANISSIFIPKHVKKIGDKAFKDSRIGKVTFAEGSELKTIGDKSFTCKHLESITIPSKVECIGEGAFESCQDLRVVRFEEQSCLKIIKKSAFYDTNIGELKLPGTVEELEPCRYNKLNSISFTSPNRNFKVLDNKIVLCRSQLKTSTNANGDEISEKDYDVLLFASCLIKEVVIPSYIKEIRSYAFANCHNLKRVTFEDDSILEKIGIESFSHSSLRKICIPKHVKIIDDSAFYFCIDLKNVNFESNSELQTIGIRAFSETLIQSISIPSNVKKIERNAFDHCKSLKKVRFSEDSELSEIDFYAFHGCPLASFHIPPLMKKIKEDSLSTKLTKITVSPKNKYLSVINNKIIVSKSDINNDKYDTILYAIRNIQKAKIPSYIKKINDNSFRRCNKLQKIEFSPDSELEIIGKNSFEGCGLTTIVIPDHVKVIDDNAFNRCKSLKKIKFTENSELEVIGNMVILDTQVKSFLIPKTVKTIRDQAFVHNGNNQTKITFSNDSLLQEIGRTALGGCANNEIIIPKHVKELNDDTFYYSLNLKKVTFPEDSDLQFIGNDAFLYTRLNSINFPSKLKELDRYWADFTSHLKNVSISTTNQHFGYLDDKIIGYKSNPNSDHYDTIVLALRDIEHVIIPSYIKRINPYAFAYCKKIKSIEFSENCELEIIDDFAFYKSKINDLITPKNVKIIGKRAFKKSSLQSITFHENCELNFIGSQAFSSTKISKFAFPNKNILIHIGILSGCCDLKEIVLSDCIDTLYAIATEDLPVEKINIPPKIEDLDYIDNLKSLKEIHVSPNNKIYADIGGQMIVKKSNPDNDVYDILYKLVGNIEKVTIPSYIKTIEQEAFKNCGTNFSVEFQENSQLEIIESNTFALSGISEIKIPKSVTRIENAAFRYSRELRAVEIPKNVTFIGKEAFCNCKGLQTVIFAEDSKLTCIGNRAFSSTSIKRICIPKHVKKISKLAFGWCHELEEVTFEKDSELEIIGASSFEETNIRSIVIPKSVVCISNYAFHSCSHLRSVLFEDQSNLKIIKDAPFTQTKIKELKLPGTVEEFGQRWCQDVNEVSLIQPNHNFKALENRIILGQSKHLFKSDNVNEINEEHDVLLFAPRSIEEVTIPSSVKHIYPLAFCNCLRLKHIKFEKGSKLENMHFESFSHTPIKSIALPKSLKVIGESCFDDCQNLSNVEFDPESNVTFGDHAFNYSKLKGIIIPKINEGMTNSVFGYSMLYSIEYLGDDCQTFTYFSYGASIMSFPNAHHVVISKQSNKCRVYILPFGKIDIDIERCGLYYGSDSDDDDDVVNDDNEENNDDDDENNDDDVVNDDDDDENNDDAVVDNEDDNENNDDDDDVVNVNDDDDDDYNNEEEEEEADDSDDDYIYAQFRNNSDDDYY